MNTKGTIIFVEMSAPWCYLIIALWDTAPVLGKPLVVLPSTYGSFFLKGGLF